MMEIFISQIDFIHTLQRINLKYIKIYVKISDCCYVEMPRGDNKIIKNNHGEKSLKITFIDRIYS